MLWLARNSSASSRKRSLSTLTIRSPMACTTSARMNVLAFSVKPFGPAISSKRASSCARLGFRWFVKVLFGLAGLAHHYTPKLRRDRPVRGPLGLERQPDLVIPLAHGRDELLWHADVGAIAVLVRLAPSHSQLAGELGLVSRAVHRIHGETVLVDVPPVDSGPATIRTLNPVGDDQVVVQEWIVLTALPVGEASRQDALSCDVLEIAAGLAAARSDSLVQVGNGSLDAGVVRGQCGARHLRPTEPIQQADVLDRPEHHVVAPHAVARMRPAEQLPRHRVAAVERQLEGPVGDLSL